MRGPVETIEASGASQRKDYARACGPAAKRLAATPKACAFALLLAISASVAIGQTTAPASPSPSQGEGRGEGDRIFRAGQASASGELPDSLPSGRGKSATTVPDDTGRQAIELYARGQYMAVIAQLAPAFDAGRSGIQDRLLLARAYLHLKQNDKAAAVLESVLKSDSQNPEANSLMGQQLFDAGKCKEAVKFLDHAYKLKKTPTVASLLGQCHFRLGERDKAKEFLEAALAEDIRNPANSFTLGKMCLADGAGALAEKFLLMAQDAGLDTVELHHLLGQAYLLQRKFTGPIIARRLTAPAKVGDIVDEHVVVRKVADQPDQYLVCTRYSALYEGLWLLDPKNATPAEEQLRAAAIQEVRTTVMVPDKGTLVLGGCRIADEIEIGHGDGILSKIPIYSQLPTNANYMAAVGWFAAGQYDLCRDALKKSDVAAPNLTRTLDLQARLAIATNDFAGLDKTLAAAADKKLFDAATVADFYYKAAVVLRAEGKRAEALALLKKADAAVPTSAPVLRALATLSVATGDRDGARQYYARIIELFPDADDIEELRNAHRNLEPGAGKDD